MVRPLVEVVHVGSAARDIAPDDPRGWRLGGGVTFAALTTARLGLRTAAVVGVDAEAAVSAELDLLRSEGVDLALVPLAEGPVFHNAETPDGRVQTVLQTGVRIEPFPLPESWRAAAAWSLTPVADELGDGWAGAMDPSTVVAVGWQGMLRHLVAGQRVTHVPPAERAILRRADLVGVSRHDVPPATSLATLTAFLRPGARLLVTQGDQGGLLVTVGLDGPTEVLHYLPTRPDHEIDPTGAGDTFLGALLAATVRPSLIGPRRSRVGSDLRFAAAAGSLAVEGPGLAGTPDVAAVRTRAFRERIRRLVLPSEAAQVGVIELP